MVLVQMRRRRTHARKSLEILHSSTSSTLGDGTKNLKVARVSAAIKKKHCRNVLIIVRLIRAGF